MVHLHPNIIYGIVFEWMMRFPVSRLFSSQFYLWNILISTVADVLFPLRSRNFNNTRVINVINILNVNARIDFVACVLNLTLSTVKGVYCYIFQLFQFVLFYSVNFELRWHCPHLHNIQIRNFIIIFFTAQHATNLLGIFN